MDYLREYNIEFASLKVGIHHFNYEIGSKFFEAIDYSEFKKGELKVNLELDRQPRMLVFKIDIKGYVEKECDRCLDVINYPVNVVHKLIFKFGDQWEDVSDEIIIIPETEHQLNMAHYLYEFISLSLPMQCIHPDDENGNSTCNKEMLILLSQHSKNREVDPRWEILKKLNDK